MRCVVQFVYGSNKLFKWLCGFLKALEVTINNNESLSRQQHFYGTSAPLSGESGTLHVKQQGAGLWIHDSDSSWCLCVCIWSLN